MGRPRKNRIIAAMPNSEGFMPLGYETCAARIILSLDEYETLRLIDYQGMTQEACAASMGVGRSTVTAIYDAARFKLADALINEKQLLIEGGEVAVHQESKKTAKLEEEKKKMKIAVTYENGQIYQHFGHCENFKIYQVENGAVLSAEVVNAGGNGHGALAGFLQSHNVDVLICGGIGGGAKTALSQVGIRLFGGVSGEADEAVTALLENRLEYNANVQCNHHGEHHGEHNCGHHDGHACGQHNCGQ